MELRDKAHPPHVGSESIDVFHALNGLLAGLPAAEVEQFKLVGGGGGELRLLDIHAADPVALLLQISDEVVADEAAGTGDEYAGLRHS